MWPNVEPDGTKEIVEEVEDRLIVEPEPVVKVERIVIVESLSSIKGPPVKAKSVNVQLFEANLVSCLGV